MTMEGAEKALCEMREVGLHQEVFGDRIHEWASVLTEALAERGWRPIESAPEEVDVLVYCKDQEPAIFSARLVNRHPSVGGMYWHPSEALVADAMAEEFNPSHWQPLPEPPHDR